MASDAQIEMALSGRQTAGAALAGAPEAGAAARIARCSHSHETLHRSRVTVPPRDRPGIIIHHRHRLIPTLACHERTTTRGCARNIQPGTLDHITAMA